MKAPSLFRSAFRRKLSIHNHDESCQPGTAPPKTLTLLDLTLLGTGGTLGSGLFLLTGHVARDVAGPAVSLSFALAAVACLFSALSYAEMASRLPNTGGAYTFTYHALGELPAFLVGTCLTLEYGVSAAAIARATAAYLGDVCQGLPNWLTGRGSPFCVLGFLLIFVIVAVLSFGLQHAKWVINIATMIYCSLVLVIIGYGVETVEPSNWIPFAPYGLHGVISGASTVFFAYIGFDEIAVVAGEAVDPVRDVPLAILLELMLISAIYFVASLVLTGTVNYSQLDPDSAFSAALRSAHKPLVAKLVGIGTVLGMTNTAIASFAAQPRLFLAMGRDGLLPLRYMSDINSISLASGVVVAFVTLLTNTAVLIDTISAGTLIAFLATSVSLLLTRVRARRNQNTSRDSPNGVACTQAINLTISFLVITAISAIAVRLAAVDLIPSWVVTTILLPLTIIPAMKLITMRNCFTPIIEELGRAPLFVCPFVPAIPLAAAYLSILLLAQLPAMSLIVFTALTVFTGVIYCAFAANNVYLNAEYLQIPNAQPSAQNIAA